MSAAGADNTNAKPDNIISTIKDSKLYVPFKNFLSKTIKNYPSFLAKDLKDQFIGMYIKRKMIIKIRQMNLYFFLNQILSEVIDYLF